MEIMILNMASYRTTELSLAQQFLGESAALVHDIWRAGICPLMSSFHYYDLSSRSSVYMWSKFTAQLGHEFACY
jgi:hypothetical protein